MPYYLYRIKGTNRKRYQQPYFPLGEVSIRDYRCDSINSNKLNAGSISKYGRLDVSRALNLLPGITLSAVGPRNESAVNVRGFDLRQVPVYLDGMPLYVP